MVRINSYQFGKIIADGKTYTSDVIIFPHRVESDWWRKDGHEVSLDDIREIIQEKPEVLVIGTGNEGRVEVLPETKRYLEEQEIELIAQVTGEACQTYNRLHSSNKAVAALHITC
jgi:hypothetical protein